MEKKRPKILLTNDDGIYAKGLWHLWHALHEAADLFIVAPTTQRSGTGVGITLHKPITMEKVNWEKDTPAWKVHGNPADCVRFGLRIVLQQKPDLIVSGINDGSNHGRNVLYSGTIGGVIEGALRDIPGIAFSFADCDHPRFDLAEPYILPLVNHLLEHPPASGTILNVNFPTGYEKFKGVKLARQGKGLWVEDPDHRVDPNGNHYFWHGGQWSHHEEHELSDVALLNQGYITVVPIYVNELTDHHFLENRKEHFDSLFKSFH